MITITSILRGWLVGSQDYTQGIDIFRRVSTDTSLISFFRRFRSDNTANRLKEEMERQYLQLKSVPAVQKEDPVVTEQMLEDLRFWVEDEPNYFPGVQLLASLTSDPALEAFFLHHISAYSETLLHRTMQELQKDMQALAAQQNPQPEPKITIKDVLRFWLIGEQDYLQGVNIFSVLSDDASLIAFFQQGSSEYKQKRLNEELEKLHREMKSRAVKPSTAAAEPAEADTPGKQPGPVIRNPELEQAAERKASQLYKQMMNDRAVLFNLTKVEGWEDVNKPELVEQRRQLALQICAANYDVTEAYDELDHIRQHGTLPQTDPAPEDAEIPDVELKPAIDNLRKNLSKLRQKEQTPERVAAIQKYEARLEVLLPRWNSLKAAT